MAETSVNVDCDEVLDISCVAELYERLKEKVTNQGDIVLNAKDVERTDAAVLQMFTTLFSAEGVNVCWNEPSEALKRSAALLGLSEKLKLPVA